MLIGYGYEKDEEIVAEKTAAVGAPVKLEKEFRHKKETEGKLYETIDVVSGKTRLRGKGIDGYNYYQRQRYCQHQ